MRIADLVRHLEVQSAADAKCGGGPFADAVSGQHGCFIERGWEKRACRVGDVVFAEQDFTLETERVPQLAAHPQLLSEPGLHRSDECPARTRVRGGVSSNN